MYLTTFEFFKVILTLANLLIPKVNCCLVKISYPIVAAAQRSAIRKSTQLLAAGWARRICKSNVFYAGFVAKKFPTLLDREIN